MMAMSFLIYVCMQRHAWVTTLVMVHKGLKRISLPGGNDVEGCPVEGTCVVGGSVGSGGFVLVLVGDNCTVALVTVVCEELGEIVDTLNETDNEEVTDILSETELLGERDDGSTATVVDERSWVRVDELTKTLLIKLLVELGDVSTPERSWVMVNEKVLVDVGEFDSEDVVLIDVLIEYEVV